jgi:LmbE family N-acetylglucosaminyl deacetylase
MSEVGRRMLLSLAHPDDESFGMAGTIARYVGEGVQVYLICATNGDVGVADPHFMEDYTSVAQLRMAELCCAAQTLGLAHIYPLGYRDSGMMGSPDNQHPESLYAADLDEVARRITAIIREVRPQVVVTFDPYGGYGHPDHIKMHQATVRAFEAAGDPQRYPEQVAGGLLPYRPQKLYFTTFDRRWLRVIVRLMPLWGQDPAQMGRNKDINLYEVAAHDSPVHARISTKAYEGVAQKARECHASQLGGVGGPRRLSQVISRLVVGPQELYTRAYPPVDGRRIKEHDLFAGVIPD